MHSIHDQSHDHYHRIRSHRESLPSFVPSSGDFHVPLQGGVQPRAGAPPNFPRFGSEAERQTQITKLKADIKRYEDAMNRLETIKKHDYKPTTRGSQTIKQAIKTGTNYVYGLFGGRILDKGFGSGRVNSLYAVDWGSDILHDVTELAATATGKASTANRERFHENIEPVSRLGSTEAAKIISELDIGHDLADVVGDIDSLGRTQMSDVQTWNSLSSQRDRAIKELEEIMNAPYQESRRDVDREIMDDAFDFLDLVGGRSAVDPLGIA